MILLAFFTHFISMMVKVENFMMSFFTKNLDIQMFLAYHTEIGPQKNKTKIKLN